MSAHLSDPAACFVWVNVTLQMEEAFACNTDISIAGGDWVIIRNARTDRSGEGSVTLLCINKF
jgi:hypothetical protein